MVSTTEVFTDIGPLSPGPYMAVKNTSASKSIRTFPEVLDVQQNTSIRRLGDDKSKCKAIRYGIMLW